MTNRNPDIDHESTSFQRRFKRALYVFALVEFLVTGFIIIYKVRH